MKIQTGVRKYNQWEETARKKVNIDKKRQV